MWCAHALESLCSLNHSSHHGASLSQDLAEPEKPQLCSWVFPYLWMVSSEPWALRSPAGPKTDPLAIFKLIKTCLLHNPYQL